MDMTHHLFGQEEMAQCRDYRDKQRDGRLRIRCIAL
jgi:hypothetical protein